MHSYGDRNGSFPPAAVVSREGKPLLSWRVLILPFIEQQELYNQFRLDEPWDSPHNIQLLPSMPGTFLPFDGRTTDEPNTTFFRVFVGNGAAFEWNRGLSIRDEFPDGTSNTVLIIQAAEAVPWTKPDELEYSPNRPLPKLGGIFRNTFQVALANGQVQSVPDSVSETTLRAAITRNGGDQLGKDW